MKATDGGSADQPPSARPPELALHAVQLLEQPETADGTDGAERHMLGEIEARLIALFRPAVRPDEVRQCVAQIAAGYADAPVRTYLAILIERAARARLRAAVLQGSCSRQSVGQRGAP